MQLPPELRNADKRRQLAQTPHAGGCASGMIIDLQRIMLGEGTSLGLV